MRTVYITWTYTDDPSLFFVRYIVNNGSRVLTRVEGNRRDYTLHLQSGDKLHFEILAAGNPETQKSSITALDYIVP